MPDETQYLTSRIDADGVDATSRTIDFAAASDRPIWRGWWGEEAYLEIIRMDEGLDLDWLNSGRAPFLFGHDQTKPIGRIVGAAVKRESDGHNVMRVQAQMFEDDPDADRYWRQIEKGAMQNVSVGFRVKANSTRETRVKVPSPMSGEDKDVPVLVFEATRMMEVSLVSVPADQSVGIGRAGDEVVTRAVDAALARPAPTRSSGNDGGTTMPEEHEKDDKQRQEEQGRPTQDADVTRADGDPSAKLATKETDDDTETRGADAPAPTVDFSGPRWLNDNEARLRSMGIGDAGIERLRAFADNRQGDAVMGRSEDAVRAELTRVLDGVDVRSAAQIDPKPAPAVHTQRHAVSVARMLDFAVRGRSDQLDGIEGEVVTDFLKRANEMGVTPKSVDGDPHSVVIPHSVLLTDPTTRSVLLEGADEKLRARADELIKRAYAVGSTPAGFHHEVFDESFFVEALIAQAKLLSKVTVLPMTLIQDLVGVTESGEITVLHNTETGTIAESSGLSFGNRTFKWHSLTAYKQVSKRTLQQSTMFFPRLLQVMRRDTVRAQNKVLINGASSSNQPVGIMSYSGLKTVAIGTNGGAPTYEHMVDLVKEVEAANAAMGDLCYVMTPEVKAKLASTARFTGSTGNPADRIIQGAYLGMPSIDGFEVITENNLPKNLTKGTGTGLHAVMFGNFGDIEMGFFSGMTLLVDPYVDRKTSQINVYLDQAYDILPRHVASVAVIKDANPS